MSNKTYTSRFRDNKLSFFGVTKSEWIKFRTSRSNLVTVAITFLVIVGFGALSASVNRHRGGGDGEIRSPFDRITTGINFAILIVAVFGSRFGAREYDSGMIRSSFSAVPRRLPVLINKAIVFSAVILPKMIVAILVSFYVGCAILKHNGTVVPKLSDPFILRALMGYAFYVLGLGLLGLFIGMLTRQPAIAIGVTVGGVIFLPALLGAILPSSWHKVLEYLPSNAGGSFTTPAANTVNALSPTAGGVVFLAWIVGVFALTCVVLKKRDV